MNQEMVKVTIDGKEHEYAIGTTYREIVVTVHWNL